MKPFIIFILTSLFLVSCSDKCSNYYECPNCLDIQEGERCEKCNAELVLIEMTPFINAGIEEDRIKAGGKWTFSKMEQGYYQNNIGVKFDNGGILKQNYAEAFKWYHAAALNGNKTAFYNLAKCYENGLGVEKDANKAAEWYQKALDNHIDQAKSKVALCYLYGYGVEKDTAKAVEMLIKYANEGDPKSQLELGTLFYQGKYIRKDKELAYQMLTEVAEEGDTKAKFTLGYFYLLDKDTSNAIKWIDECAAEGSPEEKAFVENAYKKLNIKQ